MESVVAPPEGVGVGCTTPPGILTYPSSNTFSALSASACALLTIIAPGYSGAVLTSITCACISILRVTPATILPKGTGTLMPSCVVCTPSK